MELRDKITQLRRDRDAHQMDESDYVDKVMNLIELSNVEAQIKELEDIAKNTTYNGSYMKERFMELQTRKIELEGSKPL